ncbi:hypothetical protein [Clostridium sp.]|uniref:hypothetical protein n=1 Tax=Clostridium sp. TaxID=1506 RepID=UPI002FC64210
MGILISIVSFLIMLVVVGGLYMLLRKYVFPKVHVNKYIPLAVSVILLIVQMTGLMPNTIAGLIATPVIVLCFLWFMDIQQTGGVKKNTEKKIVIKPKAKPNRAKHIKEK